MVRRIKGGRFIGRGHDDHAFASSHTFERIQQRLHADPTLRLAISREGSIEVLEDDHRGTLAECFFK